MNILYNLDRKKKNKLIDKQKEQLHKHFSILAANLQPQKLLVPTKAFIVSKIFIQYE